MFSSTAFLAYLSLSVLFSGLTFEPPAVLGAPLCGLTPPLSSATAASGTSCLVNTNSGSNSTGNTDIIAATWYAGWHSTDFPLANVSWTKYTNIIYSFAATTNDVSTLSLASTDEENISTLVSLAHENNVKASLSIGGWAGSQYFSTAVGDATNRTAFVQTVLNTVSKYGLDGIDFDWEYPNGEGIGCNTKSDLDASNFLSFLQALRAEPAGANLTLSAATSIKPYIGQDGNPLSDVSQFSKALDFISIMNYDVWGSWSATVGPNAPLNDTCAPAADQQGSAVSAVAAWTGAGFPAAQIVLGVPAYGHSFSVANSAALNNNGADGLALYASFDKASQPHGDAWDSDGTGTDVCGNPNAVGGVFTFWGLIDGGFLTANGTAASGMAYAFDNCSQTPFIYNPSTQVMVSYDDATSFAAKGKFIADTGLAGFAMWETGGDSGDILLDSIRGAIDEGTSTAGGC